MTTKTTLTKKKKPSVQKKSTAKKSIAKISVIPVLRKTLKSVAKKSIVKKSIVKKARTKQNSVLSIQHIKKSFVGAGGKTFNILINIELEVKRGDTVAIMGRSGSGKSTLISIITGLEKPDSGEVMIAGNKMTQMSENDLSEFRAENIGIVFQQFHLISHLNALDNAALPLHLSGVREGVEERARETLVEVGLEHRERQLPSKLSGGEQQRLAIARALVRRPAVLLADEPTGNLDQETSEKVIESLFNIVKKNNSTLFLVTHDLPLAKLCKRRYLLENGILTRMK